MKKNRYLVVFLTILFSGCINNTMTGTKYDINNQLLITLEQDTVKLPDVIKHKSLIFRYSVLDCKSCIDSIFYQLKGFEDIIGKENIYVFTYYNSTRHFIVSARLNQIKFKIFQIPSNRLQIEEDSLKMPYFFMIDQDLQISDVLYVHNYYSQKLDIDKYLKNQAIEILAH